MSPRTWTNGSGIPLSAENLNAMEADIAAASTTAINDATTKYGGLAAAKADKTGTRLFGEDLDTITTPGKYFQPSSVAATTALHYPFVGSNGGMVMNIESYSTTFINRIAVAYSMDGASMATRAMFNSGAWSAWAYYQTGGAAPVAATDVGIHQNMVRMNDLRRRVGQIRTNGRAAVALVADHGTNNFNEIVVPLLQETGMRATIALNSQMYDPAMQRYLMDNRTSWSIVKGWHDTLGVEIANHGRTHKDMFTLDTMKTEIIGGRQELEANLPGVSIDTYVQVGLSGTTGFMGFNNGVTLESYYTTDAGRIIIDNHALYTGGNPGTLIKDLDGHPRQGTSSYWIDTGDTSINAAKAAITTAISYGKGVSIRFHPELIDTGSYTTSAQFAEFVRYLGALKTAGSIVPMTYRELQIASAGTGVTTAPNGNRFRLAVGNDGSVSTVAL